MRWPSKGLEVELKGELFGVSALDHNGLQLTANWSDFKAHVALKNTLVSKPCASFFGAVTAKQQDNSKPRSGGGGLLTPVALALCDIVPEPSIVTDADDVPPDPQYKIAPY